MTPPHEYDNTALVEDTFRAAIWMEEVLQFIYYKRAGFGELRTLSPYELHETPVSGNLTVIGWDHMRDGLRKFELSKIGWPVEVNDTEDYVQPREKGDV